MNLALILRWILVPLLATAVLYGVLRRRGLEQQLGQQAAPALSLGFGFLAAHLAIHGGPGLPPQQGWQWVAYLVPLAAVLWTILGRWGSDRLAPAARVLFAAGMAWLLLAPLRDYFDSTAVTAGWMALAGVLHLCFGTLAQQSARRSAPGVTLSAMAGACVGLALIAALADAISVTVSLLSVGIASMVLWYYLRREPPGRLGDAAAWTLTTATVGLMNAVYHYLYDVRPLSMGILLVTWLALLSTAFPPFQNLPARKAYALRFAFWILPVAAAAAVARPDLWS